MNFLFILYITHPFRLRVRICDLHINTWKKVREHLLCYEGKLWTIIFLQSKYVLTKLFS